MLCSNKFSEALIAIRDYGVDSIPITTDFILHI